MAFGNLGLVKSGAMMSTSTEGAAAPGSEGAPINLITPETTPHSTQEEVDAAIGEGRSVRRSLQAAVSWAARAPPHVPAADSERGGTSTESVADLGPRPRAASAAAGSSHVSESNKRRRILTGQRSDDGEAAASSSTGKFGQAITTNPSVRRAYRVMNRRTGSIGGNGHGGAIYGEITEGSMQKIIELMMVHTKLGPSSRFLDVGCGLGKPNVHVALYPGVEMSYGVEMESVRWWLGMNNLDAVLGSAAKDKDGKNVRCMMAHADITEARTFDPFTHVYMFDIGFPPELLYTLASMFNTSRTSEFLICYHSPRLMIDEYGFEIKLLAQKQTSMFGSSESHMCYLYRRQEHDLSGDTSSDTGLGAVINETNIETVTNIPCDPLFRQDYELLYSSTQAQLATHVQIMIQRDVNLVNGHGSDSILATNSANNDGDISQGARKSGRERRPPKKFAIEGYVDDEDEDEE